jgi:hypothetical protein
VKLDVVEWRWQDLFVHPLPDLLEFTLETATAFEGDFEQAQSDVYVFSRHLAPYSKTIAT